MDHAKGKTPELVNPPGVLPSNNLLETSAPCAESTDELTVALRGEHAKGKTPERDPRNSGAFPLRYSISREPRRSSRLPRRRAPSDPPRLPHRAPHILGAATQHDWPPSQRKGASAMGRPRLLDCQPSN